MTTRDLEQNIRLLRDRCQKQRADWVKLSAWQRRKRKQDSGYHAFIMGEEFAYSVVIGLINRQGNEEEMQKFIGQLVGDSSE